MDCGYIRPTAKAHPIEMDCGYIRPTTFTLDHAGGQLATPEYPADMFLTGNIHLGRNLFNKLPGCHGFIAFISVQLFKNCWKKDNLSGHLGCQYFQLQQETDSKFGRQYFKDLVLVWSTCDLEKQRIPLRTNSCCKGKEYVVEYSRAFLPRRKIRSKDCIQKFPTHLCHVASIQHGTNQLEFPAVFPAPGDEQRKKAACRRCSPEVRTRALSRRQQPGQQAQLAHLQLQGQPIYGHEHELISVS